MSSNSKDAVLIALDYETNQLVPEGGHILEVAAYPLDVNLNFLDKEGFHVVLQYTAEETAQMRSEAHELVREMHDNTGLWDKLPNGIPKGQAQDELLAYIKQYAPGHRQARLLGSSIRFDMNWTEHHFPAVYEAIHYRTVDVTTIQSICDWWGIEYTDTADERTAHMAKADIMRSIKLIRSFGATLKGGGIIDTDVL